MKTIPLHQIVLAHVIMSFAIRAVILIIVGSVLIFGAHFLPSHLLSLVFVLLFTMTATFLSAKRILKKYEIPDRMAVVNNSTFLFAFVTVLFAVATTIINGFNFEKFGVDAVSSFVGIISFYLVSRFVILSSKVNI